MDDTKDIDASAMQPVRKTEAGRYGTGVDTSNLPAAGNDVDAAPPSAPSRKADVFAGKDSIAHRLMMRRKKVESMEGME